MNYHQMIIKIRSSYPNVKWLRKDLAKIRIKMLRKHLLPLDIVKKCEDDSALKNRIVRSKMIEWKKYLKTDINKARELFKTEDGKEDTDTIVDALFCRIAYGFGVSEYLPFQLSKKNFAERRKYISDIDRLCFVYQMNDISDLQIFNDKVKTYELFKKYYKRDVVKIDVKEDLPQFLSFVKKHPVFVKKLATESLGRSVELIDIRQYDPRTFFKVLLKKGKHIIEEKIEMDESIARFNVSSVNTVRCIALKTHDGVVIPWCFMRFGRKGSLVDNAGAGGVFAGIDVKTGIINTDGFDRKFKKYEAHPDSGIIFKGFQLPEWESMLDVVKEMSDKLDTIHYIGWDMVYSRKGWAMIEGNSMSQIIAPQFIYKKGLKSEIKTYMQNMDLIIESIE